MSEYVQPIAVSKTGTHEQAVVSCGLASVLCWRDNMQREEWKPWFRGSFTKSVRRGTPTQYRRCETLEGARIVEIGEARAVGLLPVLATALPIPLDKMQVSNFELPRDKWFHGTQTGMVTFVLNSELEMSTGKSGAQLAHAMVGYSRMFGFDWLKNYCVSDSKALFKFCLESNDAYCIHDAGRTEVEPGSLTVVVSTLG